MLGDEDDDEEDRKRGGHGDEYGEGEDEDELGDDEDGGHDQLGGGSTIFADRPLTSSNSRRSENDGEAGHGQTNAVPRSQRRPPRSHRRSQLRQVLDISKEALPTLILSVFSLMFSGELLLHLSRWPVFVKVDKLFILVPILLNLKGNLEMNLSLRLSTSANIGELDIRRTRETLIVGNMTLLQVQALIVSAGAGVLAFALGLVADRGAQGVKAPAVPTAAATSSTAMAAASATSAIPRAQWQQPSKSLLSLRSLSPRKIIHQHPQPSKDPALRLRKSYFEFVLVLATSMLSASLSSAILGNFMCALVVVARQTGANPDNIASPLAASLGDLLTLVIVGLLGSTLVRFEGTILATLIFLVLLLACFICFYFTLKNTYVRELLSSGWVPLIIAMFISSGAGLVLDAFVLKYQGFALLSPVLTGLPGACAAILVSRTSTALHSGKGEIALGRGHGGSDEANRPLFFSFDGSMRPTRGGGSSSSSSPPRSKVRKTLSSFVAFFAVGKPAEGWLIPATLLLIGVSIECLFLLAMWLAGQLSFSWPFMLAFSAVAVLAVSKISKDSVDPRTFESSRWCLMLARVTDRLDFSPPRHPLQVSFALYTAHFITLYLWSRDYDPDIYCLPYVSSIVDVAGQGLLVLAFAVAAWLGDDVKAVVGAGDGHGGV